ncbi:type III PLP-dependent enzyme [Polycladomyces sp. WAk]|uniref:Type III PLP-dependent enzyme n=1 Tax=Polycladomyces zharkentensis TaxID=2807616 RepID=A0ABS2WLU1_9BACL|nr:type III PLP-dependent enzyme [Polycladomyces sp. WAk]MBN2910540.1 type III PLP-dependent enzyme [Polycladomyces sp. WAk]
MNRVEKYILSERENGSGSLPAFIYDLDDLREHVRRCVQTLPKSCRLFYAIKANSEEPILRALAPIVDGFEVASIGEIRKVRGVTPDIPIIFGGPGKTDEEIEGAIDHRVQLIHVESEHELRRVAAIAAKRNITVSILLRVNLKGPLPQATLAMAGRPTQFGIEETEIPDVIRLARQLPSVRVEGFHLHSISNNLDAEQHVRLVEYYCDRVKEWAEMFGLNISWLNAGGGIGINYTELDKQFDWDLFVGRLDSMLATKCPPGVTVLFECGRFLTAACGFYAVEVLDIKKNHGKHFVVVRGGTHQFRLPVSWQHSHPFRVLPVERWDYPFPRKELTDAHITVVGQLCTPKDVLARDVYVSRVRIGDVILFSHAGAYGWAISHHDFLSHPHPRHIYLGEKEKEAADGGDSTHDRSVVHTPVD